MAQSVFKDAGTESDILDLSLLTSEYGKVIYPCKGCVSTAMPLCHWPCSCYPNHSLGQVTDWMSEIYPRWVAAQGIKIGDIVHVVRVAVTGKAVGFGLFDTLAILGCERCLTRIDRALALVPQS
jgi:multimeric flavodoxin WrbA